MRRALAAGALAAAALLPAFDSVAAQQPDSARTPAAWPFVIDLSAVTVGSPEEDRLLAAQLMGWLPAGQTVIRAANPIELDRALRTAGGDTTFVRAFGNGTRFERPLMRGWFTTQMPHAENQGQVWVGRGWTTALTAGLVDRAGPVSFSIRPVAFWSENRPFRPPLGVDATTGIYHFPDSIYGLDMQYRAWRHPVAQVEPGESWARIDTPILTVGYSFGAQVWGPGYLMPMMLGTNSGGFQHVFLGTPYPLPILIGRLSFRGIAARLDRSPYPNYSDGHVRRLGTGYVAAFQPRWYSGLEIGATRFFHQRWPELDASARAFLIPFEAITKEALGAYRQNTKENQLASVFFRLRPPTGGAEVYGEYLRDDHNIDTRDLIQEPDHESAYLVGVRRGWMNTTRSSLTVLTVEVVNARMSHLVHVRKQAPIYVHGEVPEGHTQRGRLLGSSAVLGGGGHAIMVERYVPDGGWKLVVRGERLANDQEGGGWDGRYPGFHTVSFEKRLHWRANELSLGTSARIAWDRQLGGDNSYGVFFTIRERTRPPLDPSKRN